MSDSYQPIYDAVRSRIHGCDIAQIARECLDFSHAAEMIHREAQNLSGEYMRPSVVWRPKLFPDGDQWCALYGGNIQEGVVGFGNSPSAAMYDFDKSWFAKLPETSTEAPAQCSCGSDDFKIHMRPNPECRLHRT